MSRGRVVRDRIAAAGVLLVMFLLIGASPALADQAQPTNYKSTVFDVDPGTDAASFAIIGGDAFLQVTVSAGHTVEVPGYFKEPYIRIDPDGSVWLNQDSPAYYINQDRYGNVRAPEDADGKGEPRWELAGDDGRYAWQDHRVHWMSLDLPPTVSGERLQIVFPWEVPVIVDGIDSAVRGELVWVPSRNPLPAILAGAIGLLPLVFWDRLRERSIALLLALTGGLALALLAIQVGGTPAAQRTVQASMLMPLLAVALAVAAAFWRVSSKWVVAIASGGLAVVGWGLLNAGTMWLPVLPSEVVPNVQRAGVALVMWAGVALALIAGLRLALRR